MFQVVKRDGEETEFAIARISDAIIKAFNATDAAFTNDVVDLLSLRVTADFQGKVKDGRIAVEDIQDSVERIFRIPWKEFWSRRGIPKRQRLLFSIVNREKSCVT